MGLRSWAPDLSTLFPGHWGHTHAVPPDFTAAKPVGKMRMATPMLMQALPMEGLLQGVRTTAGRCKGTVLSSLDRGQGPRDGEQLTQEKPSWGRTGLLRKRSNPRAGGHSRHEGLLSTVYKMLLMLHCISRSPPILKTLTCG